MAPARNCYACLREHRSELWYGTSDFPYCGVSYARMFRQGCRVCHPSWSVYEDCAYESDETGARICAAVYRKDAMAIREGAVLMSNSMLETRRCGRIRFNQIIEDLPAVLVMLTRMQVYFQANATVSVAAMLKVVGNSCIYTSRVTCKNVRCVRILAEAAGRPLRDCREDFAVFRRMSPHMRSALQSRGIDDYKTAMKFVEGMKEETGLTRYCLNDLIIYTCLLDRVVFDD